MGRLADGSPPGLARRVRKALTMIVRPPWSVETARLVAFPDEGESDDGLRDGPETRPDGQFRRTKGGARSS